jgi:hypothetical protein
MLWSKCRFDVISSDICLPVRDWVSLPRLHGKIFCYFVQFYNRYLQMNWERNSELAARRGAGAYTWYPIGWGRGNTSLLPDSLSSSTIMLLLHKLVVLERILLSIMLDLCQPRSYFYGRWGGNSLYSARLLVCSLLRSPFLLASHISQVFRLLILGR